MLEKIVQTIPSDPGSYLLWLHLTQSQNLTIGKLGEFTFPVGDYVYLGSARGPGGLCARLGRHIRGDGKIRWHIDYLKAKAQVFGFGYVERRDVACYISTECEWSQRLAALKRATLPKSRIVAPGFGASDCQSECTAHLIHFPILDVDQITSLLTCKIQILSSA